MNETTPRKTHRVRNGILVVALAIVGIIVTAAVNSNSSTSTNQGTGQHTITLNARGSGNMDVTYGIGDQNSQDTSAADPWSTSYTISGDVPFISMVVQNGGSGDVSCNIVVDGHVVNENTSHGGYAVVQCSSG